MNEKLAKICEEYFKKLPGPTTSTENDMFFQEFREREHLSSQSKILKSTGFSIVDDPNECII